MRTCLRMKTFIDTSVFIRHYYGVEKAVTLLDRLIGTQNCFIIPSVYEETFYKLLFMETREIFGTTGKHQMKRKFLRHPKKFGNVKTYLADFLEVLLISRMIISLGVNEKVLSTAREISFEKGLLPNDALMAAACKYYGIKRIATFDDDFKRVGFLKVVRE